MHKSDRVIGLLIITLFILMLGCNSREKVRKRDILNDDKFYAVLIDMHIADGILSATNLRQTNRVSDSISLYNFVLKKHNVSRKQFFQTVEYYTIHPEKYIIFYDSLEKHFDAMDKKLKKELKTENEIRKTRDSTNLWTMKDTWRLPEDGLTNPIAFNIQANKHGVYTLSAQIKVFKDDKSINQRMTIIANYSDGSKDLNTIATILKEEKFEEYEVSLSTDSTKVLKSISGWLLDHSKGTASKHVHVEDIKLKYSKDTD
jgi:hypothetical protein